MADTGKQKKTPLTGCDVVIMCNRRTSAKLVWKPNRHFRFGSCRLASRLASHESLQPPNTSRINTNIIIVGPFSTPWCLPLNNKAYFIFDCGKLWLLFLNLASKPHFLFSSVQLDSSTLRVSELLWNPKLSSLFHQNSWSAVILFPFEIATPHYIPQNTGTHFLKINIHMGRSLPIEFKWAHNGLDAMYTFVH